MSKPMDTQSKYRDIIEKIDADYKKIKAMRPLPAAGVAYFRNILLHYIKSPFLDRITPI